MNYEEALAGIHSRRTFSGGGPSLDRIRRLTDALGRPQEQFQAVHIAGTNGKGSVSAMTDAALRACGHKTGLVRMRLSQETEKRYFLPIK